MKFASVLRNSAEELPDLADLFALCKSPRAPLLMLRSCSFPDLVQTRWLLEAAAKQWLPALTCNGGLLLAGSCVPLWQLYNPKELKEPVLACACCCFCCCFC